MADIQTPPAAGANTGPVERTLGLLVRAGITQPTDLAAALGLQAAHIARPLRKLAMAGLVRAQASGTLQLTPSGQSWLGVQQGPPPSTAVDPGTGSHTGTLNDNNSGAATPKALLDKRAGRTSLTPRPSGPRPAHDGQGPGGAWSAIGRVGLGGVWTATRRRLRGLRFSLPPVRIALEGMGLSASAGRRIAAGLAAVAVLMIALQAGLPALGVTAVAPLASQRAAHGDPPAPATTPVPALIAAPTVAPAAPSTEQWVVVAHTDGLGLVLRSAPASPVRLVTLQEGARLRITGDPVQQAGRTWLPVTTQTSRTGWVANDFVTPAR